MGPRTWSKLASLAALAVAATLLPLASASPFDFRLPFFTPRSAAGKDKGLPSVQSEPRSQPSTLGAGLGGQGGARPSRPTRELTDWELAHCARAAFWQDTELAPLNLQVSVERGVATVDGPVPSEYLKRRALGLLERLRGIRGVRDQVRVRSTPVPAEPPTRHFPPVDRPWSEKREPSGPLPASPAEALLRPANLMSRADATEKPAVTRGQNWEPASGTGHWLPSNGVRAGLLPPEPAGPPAHDEIPPPRSDVGLGTPIVVPQDEQSELARRVEEILKADTRFAEVRFSLIKRTIHLRGKLQQESHRVDLLRALEAIREVEHVRAERIEVSAR